MTNRNLANRVAELKAGVDASRAPDALTDAGFQTIVAQAQLLLELNDREFGDELRVSRPTVRRWVRGVNLPRPVVRQAMLRSIEKLLRQQARTVSDLRPVQAILSKARPLHDEEEAEAEVLMA